MNKILLALKKHWYVYLLAIIVATSLSIYWCNFVTRPVDEQTITLFIGSYSLDKEALSNKLNEVKPDYLKEINIVSVKTGSSDFGYYFVNNGLNKADIFVLPESYVTEDMMNKQFATLNSSYLTTYFEYESDSSNHGINIHKVGQEDKEIFTFTEEGKTDENYYLFFRTNSIHIGEMSNSNFDTAIKFAKVIKENA